ncbi:Fur family transcriptional regulator [Acidobacteriota bacterium]
MHKPNRWRQRYRGQYSRWTGPRGLVLEFLSRNPGHPSAKEIYSEVQKLDSRIGLTTIYRTLDLLNRMGLINKLVLDDGQARYEYKPEDQHDHHHHLICTGCGQIIDYSEFEEEELELVRKTEKWLMKKYKYKVYDHNVDFLGICEKCQVQGERKENKC